MPDRNAKKIAAENIAENRKQWHNAPYYDLAEPDIEYQWEQVIWPIICGCDFSVVLELAPGHGRNTKKLLPLCREMHLVDLTASCIDACRARFGDAVGGARLNYYVNDGKSLPSALSGRVSLVYTWDSMVHFELGVIESYVREIARVLRPGGQAFLHHSDLKNCAARGGGNATGKWTANPHWRSAVARQEVRAIGEACGLTVELQQPVPWGDQELFDCATLLCKRA